jgi:hypothetical protein
MLYVPPVKCFAPAQNSFCVIQGCRNPIGGAIVGTFPTIWLQVKTLERLVSTNGGALHHHLPRDVVVDVRFPSVMSATGDKLGSSCFFLSLFCFVRGSSYHFISVRLLCGFIYKEIRKPVSRR